MARRFRAVIYDYGGVVAPSPFGAIRRYERALGVAEGTLSELLFGRSYAHGEGDDADEHDWHKLETGRLSMAEWYTGVLERARARFGDEFELDLAQAFAGGGLGVHWEVVHHIRRVRSQGLRTAICTNNVAEYGDHWMATIPIAETIDVVVDSSTEGVRKPGPDIYLRTAERLEVEPADCVFLDDLDANVEGAAAVGMRGILVTEDVRAALDEVEALLARR